MYHVYTKMPIQLYAPDKQQRNLPLHQILHLRGNADTPIRVCSFDVLREYVGDLTLHSFDIICKVCDTADISQFLKYKDLNPGLDLTAVHIIYTGKNKEWIIFSYGQI